ncbi:cbb3-type cytochrome c oxidase subunit 3 [Oceanibium sediminis]|uniref:cbb3-type cytochrome c oxidase subunit 3 n=1 Tax=Oceanibium sediminis TaxID=2026339 RepID=UPI000DD358B2|nr:cbb3-type cytochrome c oxidase subunit 3 [Oceanibium sediminis]
MDTYTLLREFADSWALLVLTLIFIGVVLFAFRPGSRALHKDIANIPLRNDTLPQSGEDRARLAKDH